MTEIDKNDDKLWEKFALNVRAYKIIDFPRYNEKGESIGKVCLRTLLYSELKDLDLSIAEEVDYLFTTDRKLWDASSSIMVQRYNDRKDHITTKHYLQKIIVHPDKKDKLVYPTPEHVAAGITLSEATKIFVQYFALQEGRPNFSNLSLDKFNEWVDALGKSLKKDQLNFLDRLEQETHNEFTTYLVALLSNSNQLNSSLSKQLKELITTGSKDSNLPMKE